MEPLRFIIIYKDDPNIFPLVVAATGFLVYLVVISIYSTWLETTRMTTILWSMIVVVFKYHELERSELPTHAT